MMTRDDLFLLAQTTVCDILETSRDNLVRDLENPTDEEAEAVMAFLFQVATVLEGYLIACLPEEKSNSIRAALDKASVVFAKRANEVLTATREDGKIIQFPGSSSSQPL